MWAGDSSSGALKLCRTFCVVPDCRLYGIDV